VGTEGEWLSDAKASAKSSWAKSTATNRSDRTSGRCPATRALFSAWEAGWSTSNTSTPRSSGHPPSAAVEARAENHQRRIWCRPHGFVDGDRPRDHHLGRGPQPLELDAVPPIRRRNSVSYLLDSVTLRLQQHCHGGGIVESADGQPPVRNRSPLADEHRGLAGPATVHGHQ
jgi:hypothetical protein